MTTRQLALVSILMLSGIQLPVLVAQSARKAHRLPVPFELPGTPAWLADHKFDQETFTFVRLQYSSRVLARIGRGIWMTDYPDADLALSAQVGAMTKLNFSIPTVVLKISDPQLIRYPFAYVAEAGSMTLSADEAKSLRAYLEQGGFVMFDDFWGDSEFEHLKLELKKVYPNQELKKLEMDHAIFHCVFDFDQPPQSVSIHSFLSGSSQEFNLPAAYNGIENQQGKLRILVCHNTDLADGWERAQDSQEFAEAISKPIAFPMGINAVFYALTEGSQQKN